MSEAATTPDLLDQALWNQPDLSLYMATARDAIDHAQKDPTYRATQALIGRLPRDRARAMVERLTVRAYAQGSAVARRFLAELRRQTKDTPDRELEQQVEVSLQQLYGEAHAVLCDLTDVHAAQVRPGRALVPADGAATVEVQRVPDDAVQRLRGAL